jgi:hypothetical protein
MPKIVAEPPSHSCSRLFPGPGIEVSQRLDPNPFSPRARDARGRFAKGSSGNPRGQPPGIPTVSAGAISPRAIAARTVASTCRQSSAVRTDLWSIPVRFAGSKEARRRQ